MIFFIKCSTKEAISLLLRRVPHTEPCIEDIRFKTHGLKHYQLTNFDYKTEKQCIQHFHHFL